MDLSKISKGGQIYAGAGLVYFIASFLPWYKIDIPAELQAFIGKADVNAWGDIGFLWGSLWALVFLAGAALVVLPAFGVKVPKLPAIAYLASAAVASLFTLLKLVIGEDDPIKATYGIYLATLATLGATFGAFLLFKESGGSLDDLKDPNKIKASFGGGHPGGSTPPPPPPPGMTPPPPPPAG
ncbi:MAG: hypothetical protein F2681_11580 [Actinobacteria bacterium]|uniref:Unannotated protein n=1 Tax=freshwater metagenome TaxID=449393 RepID=A0A6J7K9C2_9ZZZZ|nr:hypothetical protein [Actinomycetota bacterium]MSW78845.1 hypothetical protein [Actinomycetota bacterium]MSX56431.1 hypothetical protein [Actinomycetota bacterium]MSX93595.1 hypothetical protein [Actinomycetota bacterium]MSZ83767.1 hypothetical protein [Actinomycetota bacterium]